MSEITEDLTDIPFIGTYVAFKVDPFASLQELHDSQVDAVTKTMVTKTYVGMVELLLNVFTVADVTPFQLVTVKLISPTPPDPREDAAPEGSFFMPVLPTTFHPDGRPPLQPKPPLPWPNCYHILDLQVTLRFRRKRQHAPKTAPRLDLDEKARLRETLDGDLELFKKNNPTESDHDEDADTATQPSEGTPEGSSDEDEDDSLQDGDYPNYDGAVFLALMAADEEGEFAVPVADFLYDLSGVPDLPDPHELIQELDELKRLHEESDVRALEANAHSRNGSQYSFHPEDIGLSVDAERPNEEQEKAPTTTTSASSTKKRVHLPSRFSALVAQTKGVLHRRRWNVFSSRH